MKKMQMALLIDNFSIRAGFIKQVVEQANYFVEHGYDVTVFCGYFDKKKCFPEIKKKFSVRSIDHRSSNPIFLAIENRTIKKYKMQNLILKEKKDFGIFIVHGDPYFMLSNFFKSKFNNAKVIWHVNDLPFSYDILLQRNVPFVFKMVGPFLRMVDRYFIHSFNNITTLNKVNKKLIKDFFKKDSKVVFTGVDKFFSQIKEGNISKKKEILVLSVGAFAINRRYEDIIEAIHLLNVDNVGKRFSLKIVGHQNSSADYYKKLVKMVEDLNIKDKVFFVNSVTNNELKKKYFKADIFVQSTEHIGWTLPAMEAMLSDTPSIITNSCGLNESLMNYKEVLVVNSRSPMEIKKKVLLLVNNRELYKKIRQNGKKAIINNFMWDKYCYRYKQYINSIGI